MMPAQLPTTRGIITKEARRREKRMRKLRDMGVTMAHIAKQEGLTRQRVFKILGAKYKEQA